MKPSVDIHHKCKWMFCLVCTNKTSLNLNFVAIAKVFFISRLIGERTCHVFKMYTRFSSILMIIFISSIYKTLVTMHDANVTILREQEHKGETPLTFILNRIPMNCTTDKFTENSFLTRLDPVQ
jgi:hypothetical protein